MIAVRMHRDVYRGAAVDEAVKVYAPHATLELSEDPLHWTVQVSAASPLRERRIAGELANYALGLTVKGRRTTP